METQCEELVNLTVQAGKQVPAEAEAEVLEELEEDMDHREGMVETLGQALMDAVPENLKARVEEAMKESIAVAAKGRQPDGCLGAQPGQSDRVWRRSEGGHHGAVLQGNQGKHEGNGERKAGLQKHN